MPIRTRLIAQTARQLAALVLLAFCTALPLQVEAEDDPETRDPREFFFTQTFGDLPEELRQARDEGKWGMLLFFEQEGCPSCRQMMRTVLNQAAVQDWYSEKFVSIAVDINGSVELRDFDGITLPSKVFAAHRKVKTTPVISYIDPYGVEVFRWVRVVKSPQEFLWMGKYVTEGHYADIPWREFLERKTNAGRLPDGVPLVRNLQSETSGTAGHPVPVLLAITREGCPYCARLRREVLVPMIRSGEYDERVLIRELMMEPDTVITGFDGQATTTAEVARRYGVEITPTVLLLDFEGRALHEPIIGINNSEMYAYQLDSAIEKAALKLTQRQSDTTEETLP